MKRFTLLLIFASMGLCQTARAERFINSYVSFELPPNLNCNLDGTEWICVSKFAKNVKEAIIVLTAKEAGPTDSLINFESQIKTPRALPNKTGASTNSKVLSVKARQIGGHPWVDGLHEGSEITSYYTRYVATVKERLAILVTFSAHKAHYTKYSNDFLKAVESLKVIASRDLVQGSASAPQMGRQEIIGGPGVPIIGGGEVAPPPAPTKNDGMTKILAGALIAAAILILVWRRSKK